MGYNLKTPSWDLAELEKESIPCVSHFLGSSTCLGGRQDTEGDCSVDLKLGRLSDLGDRSVSSFKNSMMESSSSGSAKRARTPGNGTQIVSCLVDGCKSDLSKCRDYHRRHKVCELHSKTAKVTIGGHEQRFCQQCSRYQICFLIYAVFPFQFFHSASVSSFIYFYKLNLIVPPICLSSIFTWWLSPYYSNGFLLLAGLQLGLYKLDYHYWSCF